MKNKLNLIANLVLLLVLDSTLMVVFYNYTKNGYNHTEAIVATLATVFGLFFVYDTYKLLKPQIKAFVAPSFNYEEEGEDCQEHENEAY